MKDWTAGMKNLKKLAALALVLSPSLAFAHPNRGSSAHMRPNLFRARMAQPHVSTSTAHH